MKVGVAEVRVGQRRREDQGDIDGLARSLQRFGLLHPIVIDSDGNLVVGGRRLLAAIRLGWTDIEARNLGDLSEDERSLIELEENTKRKDLTEYERSKAVVRAVEQAQKINQAEADKHPSQRSDAEHRPAGPAANPSSQAKAAERVGVSPPTVTAAKKHVAVADRYPELRPFPQDTALKVGVAFDKYPMIRNVGVAKPQQWLTIAESLDALPEERRQADVAAIERDDDDTIARLAGLPPMPKSTEDDRRLQENTKAVDSLRAWLGTSLTKTRGIRDDRLRAMRDVWPPELLVSDVTRLVELGGEINRLAIVLAREGD